MSPNYVSGFARKMGIAIALPLAVAGLLIASLVPYSPDKDAPLQYPRDCYDMVGCIDPQTGIMWRVK